MALAFITGIALANHIARKEGLNPEHVINIMIVIVPGAIIGARIYYVLFEWQQYAGDFMSGFQKEVFHDHIDRCFHALAHNQSRRDGTDDI